MNIRRLLFPPGAECLLCGNPRRADETYSLCPECRAALLRERLRENLCLRCMHPMNKKGICPFCKAGRMEGLSAGYGAYHYGGLAGQLIRTLKFRYQDEAAAALSAGMSQCFPAAGYDALVPVPLHRSRLRMRGANQAEILSRQVGERTGLPVMDVLVRTRPTRPQTRLDAKGRRENVEGAFALRSPVKGLRLLLVDDVRTTGATARACARVLSAGGAKNVGILTAAIAVQGAEKRK